MQKRKTTEEVVLDLTDSREQPTKKVKKTRLTSKKMLSKQSDTQQATGLNNKVLGKNSAKRV